MRVSLIIHLNNYSECGQHLTYFGEELKEHLVKCCPEIPRKWAIGDEGIFLVCIS